MRRGRSRFGRRTLLWSGLALAGLGLVSGCGSLAPPAQRSARVPVIGLVAGRAPDTWEAAAFRQGLAEHGYGAEGAFRIESRFGFEEAALAERAADLIKMGVDVLVATTAAAARAAKRATETVPIVIVGAGDPVAGGLVASLARPGGNVTGLTSLSSDLAAKRLDLLKEVVPGASRVAAIRADADPEYALAGQQIEATATQLGLQLVWFDARPGVDLSAAIEAAGRLDAAVLLLDLYASPIMLSLGDWVPRLARRLPAICSDRTFVSPDRSELTGILMSYATNRAALFRRAAAYIDRILKGAKPAELPIEQPTTFDFVVNLRTAQVLGLPLPPSVLQQATEILQ